MEVSNLPDANDGYGVGNATLEDLNGGAPPSTNQLHYASLAPDQQASYAIALRNEVATSGFDADAHDGVTEPTADGTSDGTGGCEASARALISEPANNAWPSLAVGAASILEMGSDANPTFDQLEGAWVECMRASGTPFEAVERPGVELAEEAEELPRNAAPEEIEAWRHEEELRVATNDIACRASSGIDAYLAGRSRPKQMSSPKTTETC